MDRSPIRLPFRQSRLLLLISIEERIIQNMVSKAAGDKIGMIDWEAADDALRGRSSCGLGTSGLPTAGIETVRVDRVNRWQRAKDTACKLQVMNVHQRTASEGRKNITYSSADIFRSSYKTE